MSRVRLEIVCEFCHHYLMLAAIVAANFRGEKNAMAVAGILSFLYGQRFRGMLLSGIA